MLLTSPEIDFNLYNMCRSSLEPTVELAEKWIPVYGSAGKYYEVSDIGRFRCCREVVAAKRSRWAKVGQIRWNVGDVIPQTFGEYVSVSFYVPEDHDENYSSQYSHVIIAKSFYNSSWNGYTDHINSNKHDNRVVNLQQLTPQENSLKMYIKDEGGHWSGRKSAVVAIESMRVYPNIKSACVDTGLADSHILTAIKRGTTAGGKHWQYVDAEKQQSVARRIPKRVSEARIRAKSNLSNWIRCIETDEVMLCADMATKYSCQTEVIYNAIDFNQGYSKHLGLHFSLCLESEVDLFSEQVQR